MTAPLGLKRARGRCMTRAAPMSSTPAHSAAGPDVPPGPSRKRRVNGLEGQEFCVIDVETTGFSPRLGDRVVEIAAVRMRGDGAVLAEWSTLVNPCRDIGATHVHGITAGDVLDAPRFDEIAGDVLAHFDGDVVVVAHNLRFDWEFVAAEYQRSGHDLPRMPGLCTLALGSQLHPGSAGRRLAACCARIGYAIPKAHAALEDARAAGALLTAYVADAGSIGVADLESIGCSPLAWPETFPVLPVSGKRCERGHQQDGIATQASYLARLVTKLDDVAISGGVDVAAYLDVLDRALEDRRLSRDEADALHATALDWGLDATDVTAAHSAYFDSLIAAALADGLVTDNERTDLELVATLLGLPAFNAEEALGGRSTLPGAAGAVAESSLAGLSVCFTGTLAERINGELITRTVAQQLASSAGLEVRDSVTKGLDLLVVADPDTQSGKAKRARQLGTRVMAEAVFWRAIGVTTE